MKRFYSFIIIIVLFLLINIDASNSLILKVSALDYDYEYFISEGNELCIIHNVEDLDKFLGVLDIEIYSQKLVCDRIIIEGYSNDIDNSVMLNGLKTNIQLSYVGEELIIGSPLIVGSF